MKKFIKDNVMIIIAISVPLSAGIFVSGYFQHQSKQAEIKLVEDVFFNECIKKNDADLEYRRTCGRAAKAYANGHLDYKAYGQTITWDEEARMYVIKGEVK